MEGTGEIQSQDDSPRDASQTQTQITTYIQNIFGEDSDDEDPQTAAVTNKSSHSKPANLTEDDNLFGESDDEEAPKKRSRLQKGGVSNKVSTKVTASSYGADDADSDNEEARVKTSSKNRDDKSSSKKRKKDSKVSRRSSRASRTSTSSDTGKTDAFDDGGDAYDSGEEVQATAADDDFIDR